jgi:hypothetical protein
VFLAAGWCETVALEAVEVVADLAAAGAVPRLLSASGCGHEHAADGVAVGEAAAVRVRFEPCVGNDEPTHSLSRA